MKKINRILLYIFFAFFLHSCGTMSEAGKVLRNEKIKTTDEFLVKKREPLVLPPDYDVLPKPGMSQRKLDNSKGIDTILKIPNQTESPKSNASSVEQSIINKIGQWKIKN